MCIRDRYKVVIPYSISGITSGVVLGIGRAIGETMAVLMAVSYTHLDVYKRQVLNHSDYQSDV